MSASRAIWLGLRFFSDAGWGICMQGRAACGSTDQGLARLRRRASMARDVVRC